MASVVFRAGLLLLLLRVTLDSVTASRETKTKLGFGEAAVNRESVNKSTEESLPREDSKKLKQPGSSDGHITCPHLWFLWNNGSCHCGSDVHGVVKCDPDTKEVAVLDCNCLTIEYTSNGAQIPVAGSCIFNCVNNTDVKDSDPFYHSAPSHCASLNRQGTLCGQCLDGYTVPAYSYEFKCIRCDSELENWGLYIVFAFLPLTVFIVIILVFRINVISPKLYTFVFSSQLVSSPVLLKIILYFISTHEQLHGARYRIPIAFFSTFYGIWNLDFFRVYVWPKVCINAIPLHILVLDYLIAIYPMLLMAVTYTMVELYGFEFRPLRYVWKPFHYFFARFRRHWGIQTTIMDAFVTFFFLSTTKLLSVSFALLMSTKIYTSDGKLYSHSLYYDPSIKYFGKEHLPYALMAIAILVFFIAFPTSLLLFYQFKTYRKCLARCQVRGTTLDKFVDTFQKYYKDGSNGTWDCRWFAGFFILMNSTGYVIYSLAPTPMFFLLATILFTIGAAVVVIVEPYKKEYSIYNIVTANLLLWQTMLSASFSYENVADIYQQELNDHFLITSLLCLFPIGHITVVTLLYVVKRFRKSADGLTSSLPHRLLHPDQY